MSLHISSLSPVQLHLVLLNYLSPQADLLTEWLTDWLTRSSDQTDDWGLSSRHSTRGAGHCCIIEEEEKDIFLLSTIMCAVHQPNDQLDGYICRKIVFITGFTPWSFEVGILGVRSIISMMRLFLLSGFIDVGTSCQPRVQWTLRLLYCIVVFVFVCQLYFHPGPV